MSPVRYGKGDKGEARWSSLPRGPQAPFPRTCLSTCLLPGLQAHGAPLPRPMLLSSFAQCCFPKTSLFFPTQAPCPSLITLTGLSFFLLHSSPLVSYGT